METGTAAAFRWLRTGEEAFAAMLAAIAEAKESVALESYIYQPGPVGEQFRAALVAACKRGVKVQVLLDAFGSYNLPNAFWTPLVRGGGEFAWFNPLGLNRWTYRNHRKQLICDRAVAFIGGFNIGREYQGDGITRGWRDLGLQITGALAEELAESFDTFFARATFKHKRFQRLRKAPEVVTTGPNWKLLLSGPGRRHGEVKRTLGRDVAGARSVQIICAYFLPTWRLRKELMRVSKRGGRVQLLLAGKTDVAISQLACRRLYQQFLRAGVEIYEYQPQILHAKLFIVDDFVYAGSANLDTRSLRINHELVVRIADAQVAAGARAIFEHDLQFCRRIDPKTWRQSRTLWSKLKEDWAYFVLARMDPYIVRRQLKTVR